MSGYDEARRRFHDAVAARDRVEARRQLDEMHRLVDELDPGAIAGGVRDLELWLMAQSIEWRWLP